MISKDVAICNFERGCKEWFREKYKPLEGSKLILFGNAAKCAMMIKALDEIGMRKNITAITCNDLESVGGV